MVQANMRLPGFCMNRAMFHVRVPSPPPQSDQTYNSDDTDDVDKAKFLSNSIEVSFNGGSGDMSSQESDSGNRRIMVVIDLSHEANEGGGALQWALSHTVQSHDTVVLLHVTKQGANSGNKQRVYELLCSMKDTCQMRWPGVQVEIAMVEGSEKGPTIVEEAKQQRVSLLVLGQKKRSVIHCLRKMWTGKRTSGSKVVEHCIQNAGCMTVAVRRKRRRYGVGGYLITTKLYKNFWLLA